MAKIFGFVAEFNPFHFGHQYFIDQIKEKYHPDVLITVMSGNYVQRGDFAVLDKWQRAKLAVDHGVDIVLELPYDKSVQSADRFADGAIRLLNQAGVTDLVFGTELGLNFSKAAQVLLENDSFEQKYDQTFARNLNDRLLENGLNTVDNPNAMLGINYVAAILQHNFSMQTHQVERSKSSYSATAIREQLICQDYLSLDKQVPKDTAELLKENSIVDWDQLFPYLRYKILTTSSDDLQLIYQMVEGLNYKLKKEIIHAKTYSDLLFSVKSKRYTLARIRRLFMYTLMNTKQLEMETAFQENRLRILGFDKAGQTYLHQLKEQLDQPVITRVGQKESQLLTLDVRADTVLKTVTNKEENFGVIPYIKEEN